MSTITKSKFGLLLKCGSPKQNTANANRVSMPPRQTLQSNDVKDNDNIIVDKQKNEQEEKTYGFIDAAEGWVKLD
ncbi:MAG: hypothetical protein WAW13_03515 [Minisyncoccia bacterium]